MRRLLLNLGIVVFVVVSSLNVLAQTGKVKKANKDFDRYEYIDAREIYIKVVEDGYASAQIYENLGDTYYWNSDYSNAAKWYNKLISEFPEETEIVYFYRASQANKSINNSENATRYMDMYIARGGDPGILKAINTEFLEYIVQLKKASINTSASDFGPSFYQNNVVFASTGKSTEGGKIAKWNDQPFTDLFIATMDENGALTSATSLQGDVNTKYHESTPTFTKDGKTMYFTRNNFIDGKKGKDKNKTIKLKLYRATKSDNGKWENVVELPFNDKEYSMAHPALSKDEKKLYFSSEIPGGIGMSDIYYVDITGDNQYGTPVNLGPEVNTEARESFPFISDKNNLYFSSDGRGGLGGYDIFMAKLDANGVASNVMNIGEPANSSKDDFGFIVNEEKRFGFLSSNRDGEEGSINDDIYLVNEDCKITISGVVFDVDTNAPIAGANVMLLDEENNVIDQVIVGAEATYSFTADCEKRYAVRGTKEMYAPYEQIIQTPNKTSVVEVPIPLKTLDPCPPDDLGCRLDLQPIYFDFDRFNIRPDAEIELAKILSAMRVYPELKIDIESHTDARAPKRYNEILSERRAQSTLKWLVAKGIDKSRLTAKGYGENQLVNKCADGVACTEEEHQLNRRSMFIIVN
ncbi:OmpA family protein [Rasiella sp. SM2506]|uniref:OmpA family protein n=1 Tax=Rasiella sp. SM2506 TaxID=3423914 RepID=UPI003D7BE85F